MITAEASPEGRALLGLPEPVEFDPNALADADPELLANLMMNDPATDDHDHEGADDAVATAAGEANDDEPDDDEDDDDDPPEEAEPDIALAGADAPDVEEGDEESSEETNA